MNKKTTLQDQNTQEITIIEYNHEQKMSMLNILEVEIMLIDNIENHLGFSLNDDDAKSKLNQLSEIIEIPNILYQYTT